MLTELLGDFTNAVATGIGNIQPFISKLLYWLLVIDFALWGFKISLGGNDADIGAIAWKLLTTGLLYFIITNFASLSWMFENTIINITSKISGRTSVEFFMEPEKIIEFAAVRLLQPMNEMMTGLKIWRESNLGIYIGGALVWIIVVLCFVLIAINMVLAVLEFHLLVLFSLILVPFLIFEPTRFIGNKPFGAVIGTAVKIGMLVLVVGIMINIYGNLISFPSAEELNFKWMLNVMVVSIISTYVVIQIPGIAAALLSGVPSLSAGGAFRTFSGLAAGVSSALMLRGKRGGTGGGGGGGEGGNTSKYDSGKSARENPNPQSGAAMFRSAQNEGARAAGAKTAPSSESPDNDSGGRSAASDFRPEKN